MANLIDETPLAVEYVQGDIESIGRYKRFQAERFARLSAGVLATSELDVHGDLFNRAALGVCRE
jgi:hypothetical protein